VGGFGSGRWTRHHSKPTTAGRVSLDVRYLCGQGLLSPGRSVSLSWNHGDGGADSIRLEVTDGGLLLNYRVRQDGSESEDVREEIALTWTTCHYGGGRAWFICPGTSDGAPCGRRVAILYLGELYFCCRHCYSLAYESQREDVGERHRRKAQTIRRRLGGGSGLLEGLSEKPKGMHWRTYDWLSRQVFESEVAYHDALAVRTLLMLDRLEGIGARRSR
jgi:hypothetical protein